MTSLPPLELSAVVTTADRVTFRWDANQAVGSIPQGLQFRSKIGEGFSDGSLNLTRRIDLDYPDLELLNDVTVIGADGSVAYEGRLAAMPREIGDGHSIGVTLTGWMAHAKDRKFQEIYVDRDLGAWGNASLARQSGLLAINQTPHPPESTTDPSNLHAGITTLFEGPWLAPYLPRSEAWYDAGPGCLIGKIGYSWQRRSGQLDATDPWWTWEIGTAVNDQASVFAGTGTLRTYGPVENAVFTPGAWYRYAVAVLVYGTAPAGNAGNVYAIDWYKLAVYGTHGLTTYAGEPNEPAGVRASDVIKNVAERWCPLLDTSGVQDTSYVIQHLAFKDRTYPYDAFLEANKYHLWHLGVWENRTLTYRPYDLTDYQWEVRISEPGVTFSAQGLSTDDTFNGIVVAYTDLVTGTQKTLTPTDNATLRDTAPDNPWNKLGVPHWDEIDLSTPTLAGQALEIGRWALVERNRPKAPGTITVKGHLRDRAGNWQQVWKVRAGDTIAITDHPNDRPRLIHEASYTDDDKTMTLAIDAPAATLDAYLDRVGTTLQARGLT